MTFLDTPPPRLSDNHYNNLDDRASSRGDETKCSLLISEFRNDFNSNEFESFCKKITGAIGEYSVMPTLINLDKYRCKYFNLWICDNMLKLLKDLKHPKFNNIKNKITEIWEKNNLKNNCEWHFISYIHDSDYDKIKKLYEYALNYSTFKRYFVTRNKLCNTDYKIYIEESLKIYEEAKHKCTSGSHAKSLLCTALQDVQSVYEGDELSTITCNGEISIEKIRAEVQKLLTKEQAIMPPLVGASQSYGDQNEIENLGQLHENTPKETSSFSNTQKATSVVFPLFGILLSFFLFYKFTPAATWLHSHLQSKKNISFNLNEEETHDLLENTHNSIIENSNTHLVGYHPS
ncbi:Plasmodium vivax Vir protein, putative [Plasmodium ovale]|uniref:Plasmodium vivax Vir protein, putative n=1 Tax=Plasmodium ovale TaxID=36330 RepID=A0A1C3KIA9_PLAOA|nr:Plasmodium vivax Vir protein, putative [Plasmodium ovale]